jgi:hypothetical protein
VRSKKLAQELSFRAIRQKIPQNFRDEASKRCTISHEGVSKAFFNTRWHGPASLPKLNSMGGVVGLKRNAP